MQIVHRFNPTFVFSRAHASSSRLFNAQAFIVRDNSNRGDTLGARKSLGHASVAMTLDGYSHWISPMGDQTARAMEAVWDYFCALLPFCVQCGRSFGDGSTFEACVERIIAEASRAAYYSI